MSQSALTSQSTSIPSITFNISITISISININAAISINIKPSTHKSIVNIFIKTNFFDQHHLNIKTVSINLSLNSTQAQNLNHHHHQELQICVARSLQPGRRNDKRQIKRLQKDSEKKIFAASRLGMTPFSQLNKVDKRRYGHHQKLYRVHQTKK